MRGPALAAGPFHASARRRSPRPAAARSSGSRPARPDVLVRDRARQAVIRAQGQEPLLHLAPGERRRVLESEHRGHLRRSPPSRRAREDVIHRASLEQPLDLRLVDEPLDAAHVHPVRAVEDRAGNARAWDPRPVDDVATQEDPAVGTNSRPRLSRSGGGGDIDRPGSARHQLEVARRRAMGQRGARSARERRRHQPALPDENRVSDGVDAVVDAVQLPARGAGADPRRRHPEGGHLPEGHDAVLTRGELGEPPVEGFARFRNSRCRFRAHPRRMRAGTSPRGAFCEFLATGR